MCNFPGSSFTSANRTTDATPKKIGVNACLLLISMSKKVDDQWWDAQDIFRTFKNHCQGALKHLEMTKALEELVNARMLLRERKALDQTDCGGREASQVCELIIDFDTCF